MTPEALREAVGLAARGGRILVATADRAGAPHLAAAGGLRLLPDGRLEITAWFCPGTVENLAENPNLSLTVWDPDADRGHQILGAAERIEEREILDGYAPGLEPEGIPQAERAIVLRPRTALVFTLAPHSDREE